MNCDEILPLLHAYADDELDLATALRIETHLSGCTDCQKRLDAIQIVSSALGSAIGSDLNAAVSQPVLYQAAPVEFRDRMARMIRAEAPAFQQPISRKPVWWKSPRTYSGLIAAMILIAVSVPLVRQRHAPHGLVTDGQTTELLDAHLRALEAKHLLDVESTDQHTVKPWFAGKLDFSPPVIDLSAEGFPLIGGRLDYLDQRKIAALIYRRNKHLINLFIQPGTTSDQTDAINGFNLIRFECKSMTCWAVSDLNTAELQQFTELFKQQKPASTRF